MRGRLGGKAGHRHAGMQGVRVGRMVGRAEGEGGRRAEEPVTEEDEVQ